MDVKVTAESSGGEVVWTIDGKKPHESVIDLPNKSGQHTLDFHLDDRTNLGLAFDAEGPIWVHQNALGQCPGQGSKDDQITVDSCKPKKLSIVDSNSGDPCTLHYQLNFRDDSGTAFEVDPIINNGGSTTPLIG